MASAAATSYSFHDMIRKFPLSDHEVFANIFYYLWTKTSLGKTIGSFSCVSIPNTVFYRNRQAYAWFFTSRDGTIKRKNKHNVHNSNIEKSFCAHARCDITSVLIQDVVHPGGQHEMMVEYFDQDELHEFLYSRRKPVNGILQQFILSKGVSTATMRMMWAPQVAHLERRVNTFKIADTRIPRNHRAVTYDGDAHLSRVVPVKGAVLPNQCRDICQAIAKHLESLAEETIRVSEIAAHFRLDSEGHIWLLWISHIQTEGGMVDFKSNDQISSFHNSGNVRVVPLQDNAWLDTTNNEQTWSVSDRQLYQRVAHAIRGSPGPLCNSILALQPAKPHPRGTHGMTELLPNQCPSCGSFMSNDSKTNLRSVAYKTIVVHYDQTLKKLGLSKYPYTFIEDEKSDTSNARKPQSDQIWPTMEQALLAAGSIGIYGVYAITNEDITELKRRIAMHPQYQPLPRIVRPVPPVLHLLHPNLNRKSLDAARKETTWLFTQASVCERCFLVYSEVASELISGSAPRHAVDAINGPKQALIAQMPLTSKERIHAEMERARAGRDAKAAELRKLKTELGSAIQKKATVDAQLIVAKALKQEDKVKALENTSTFRWTPQLAKTAVSLLSRQENDQNNSGKTTRIPDSEFKFHTIDASPGIHIDPIHEQQPLHDLLVLQSSLMKWNSSESSIRPFAEYDRSKSQHGKWLSRQGPGVVTHVDGLLNSIAQSDVQSKSIPEDTMMQPNKTRQLDRTRQSSMTIQTDRTMQLDRTRQSNKSDKKYQTASSSNSPLLHSWSTLGSMRQSQTIRQEQLKQLNLQSANRRELVQERNSGKFEHTTPIVPAPPIATSGFLRAYPLDAKQDVSTASMSQNVSKYLNTTNKRVSVEGLRKREHISSNARVDAYLEIERMKAESKQALKREALAELEEEERKAQEFEMIRQNRQSIRDGALRDSVVVRKDTRINHRQVTQQVSDALAEMELALENALHRAGIRVGEGHTRPYEPVKQTKGNKTPRKNVNQPDLPPLGCGILASQWIERTNLYGKTEHIFQSIRQASLGEYQATDIEISTGKNALAWLQQFSAGIGHEDGDDPDSKINDDTFAFELATSQATNKVTTPYADKTKLRDVEVMWGRGMYVVETLQLHTGEVQREYINRFDTAEHTQHIPLLTDAIQQLDMWHQKLDAYGIDWKASEGLVRTIPPGPGAKRERVLLPPWNPTTWGAYYNQFEENEFRKLVHGSSTIWTDDNEYTRHVNKQKKAAETLETFSNSISQDAALVKSLTIPPPTNEILDALACFGLESWTSNNLVWYERPHRPIENKIPSMSTLELRAWKGPGGPWRTDVCHTFGIVSAIPNTLRGVIAWGLLVDSNKRKEDDQSTKETSNTKQYPNVYLMYIIGHPDCHPTLGEPFTVYEYSFSDCLTNVSTYSLEKIVSHPAIKENGSFIRIIRQFIFQLVLLLPESILNPGPAIVSQPNRMAIQSNFYPQEIETSNLQRTPKMSQGLIAIRLRIDDAQATQVRYCTLHITMSRNPAITVQIIDAQSGKEESNTLNAEQVLSPNYNPFISINAVKLLLLFGTRSFESSILVATRIIQRDHTKYLLALRLLPPVGYNSIYVLHPDSQERRNYLISKKDPAKHETPIIPQFELCIASIIGGGPWKRNGYNPYPSDYDGTHPSNTIPGFYQTTILNENDIRNPLLNPFLEQIEYGTYKKSSGEEMIDRLLSDGTSLDEIATKYRTAVLEQFHSKSHR